MNGAHNDALAFVAPGLVHRLGNAIFTIQGHAQLLSGIGPEGRERKAILNATERGGRTLALMRALLGAPRGPAEDARELLALLGEILAIPIRERGHTIGLRLPDDAVFRGVEPSSFSAAVLEAVHHLLAALPDGLTGRVDLGLFDGDRGRPVARVVFTTDGDRLPFPLRTEALAEGLGRALQGLEPRPEAQVHETGVDLRFGGAVSGAAEADPGIMEA